MAWWDERMVAVDVETTGPEPEDCRIVSASVALVGGGEATDQHAWIVDPGVEVPAEAAAIHGLTTEIVREQGAPAAEAVAQILRLLEDASLVVAFNARFDLTVLDREARRYDLQPPGDAAVDLLVVDPFVLDKWLDKYRRGSRKLGPVCAHYGVRFSEQEAHEAAADAIAAARLAWVLGAKGRVVRRGGAGDLEVLWEEIRGDAEALHLAQVEMAREQAEGLREHFASKGKIADAARVRGEWPIMPVAS
jgi:DNA polymerase-3 subunit epsilon